MIPRFLSDWLRPANPARDLALIGAAKRKQAAGEQRRLILIKAREMRRKAGLPVVPEWEGL